MFIDTHAHLYASKFDADRAEMIQRAIDNGVTKLFLPNIDRQSIAGMYALVNHYPHHCYAMMGVHPCSIKADFEEELAIAKAELDKAPHHFYAVGEIGLDYYWDVTYEAQQKAAFRTQINWAKEKDLPIVIHCRDSFDDIYDILKDMNDDQLKGILHCFVGTVTEAQKIMDLGGFYLGVGGVVTHKKTNLPEVLKSIPLDYLVLETDAPYLVPAPYRYKKKANKRNESSYIPLIAQKVAEIKGIAIAKVAEVTTANAEAVFQMEVVGSK